MRVVGSEAEISLYETNMLLHKSLFERKDESALFSYEQPFCNMFTNNLTGLLFAENSFSATFQSVLNCFRSSKIAFSVHFVDNSVKTIATDMFGPIFLLTVKCFELSWRFVCCNVVQTAFSGTRVCEI